jgi:predicted Zn-dependent peptidase
MMKKRLSVVVFGAALTLAPLDAAVRPPHLQYEITTLPNGLTVVLSEDHSTPIVHTELWYHVGSKDEKAGRTGFAHLFEHMMFKGSKNVDPEEHASMIASIGGQSNAYTNDDATVFWQTVPSQYLPLVLWLEADRMATLRIDEGTFKAEREVVKEERRLRVDNQPFGRLSEILYDNAFTVHPYKHTTIGSMKDLDAASIADVRDFYNTFYVPGNATLAIVGDFDAAQALELVTKYFARIPKSTRPIPREYPKEPAPGRERRVTTTESWPLSAVVVAYPITYDGHPDSYALHITSKILSDGESSRIFKSLVYEKGIAVSAFGGGNILEEPNLFFAVALVQPGHAPEEVEKALIAEFDKLRQEPVAERELQRAKNQFFRDYIVDRETIRGKASQLAHAVVIHGDVTTADGEVEIFTDLKVADVQRVAKTYFTPENRLVLRILPKSAGSR